MSDQKRGSFLVTETDEESAVLRDVHDAQVHTLSECPDVAVDDVLEATLEPEPPMDVTWRVVEIQEVRTIPVEQSSERPTKQARDIAAEQPVGELTRQERAGEGALHIITVPKDQTEEAAADVVADETTLLQAARQGVDRVEVRADAGVISVRYLPS